MELQKISALEDTDNQTRTMIARENFGVPLIILDPEKGKLLIMVLYWISVTLKEL